MKIAQGNYRPKKGSHVAVNFGDQQLKVVLSNGEFVLLKVVVSNGDCLQMIVY